MKIVDLFCGCGGLSLGFQNAGFEIVAAYDIWQAALSVYNKNFAHEAKILDLSNIEESVKEISAIHPDMIIGGPPCQDFSSAGKRDEDNGRGDLTVNYAQIINSIRPKWFVMENVERITKTQKLVDARKILKEAGYGLSWQVLDASKCGVPQKRKRFFMIGKLHEQDDFMAPFLQNGLSKTSMTLRDYFGDSLGLRYYYRHPRSYARRGIFSIDEPSPTIRGVNRPMPKGYQIHANDPVDSKEGIRALTTIERSYIQTFPKTFKFEGSKTELEQMIGNAVPVKLAEYVAKSINKYLEQPHRERNLEIDFQNFLLKDKLAAYVSEPNNCKRLRVYTLYMSSNVRTFAPSFKNQSYDSSRRTLREGVEFLLDLLKPSSRCLAEALFGGTAHKPSLDEQLVVEKRLLCS